MKNKRYMIALLAFGLLGCGPDVKRIEEADVHFQIAKDLYTKGDTIRAMVEATKAAEIDSTNYEVQNFLGALHFQRGEVENAEKNFRRAIKVNKDFSEAHNNLCVLLMQKNNLDEALTHCTKAVENISYPTPERAYHNLGYIHEQKGDLSKAAEFYRRALSYNKNFVLSLKSLSKIHLNQGHAKEALPFLETAAKACNAAPKGSWLTACPEVHWELAKLYIQMKKRPEALTALKDCESADDAKGEYGQKCRDKLKLYQ